MRFVAVAVVGVLAAGGVAAPGVAAVKAAKPYDFDGDGHREVVVPWSLRGVEGHVVVYGKGGKVQHVARSGEASADFDRDGRADLATITGDRDVTIVFGGKDGLGSRTRVVQVPLVPDGENYSTGRAGHLAAGDFDGDGRADLAVSEDNAQVFFVLSDAGRSSVWSKAYREPMSDPLQERLELYAGDVTGDGRTDLITFTADDYDAPTSDIRLFRGTAQGLASRGTRVDEGVVWSVATGDLNKDGRQDLVLKVDVDEQYPRLGVRYGTAKGLGGFYLFTRDTKGVPGAEKEPGDFGHTMAIGDLNGDGRQDLAIATGNLPTKQTLTFLFSGKQGFGVKGAWRVSRKTRGVPPGQLLADVVAVVNGEAVLLDPAHLTFLKPSKNHTVKATRLSTTALGLPKGAILG